MKLFYQDNHIASIHGFISIHDAALIIQDTLNKKVILADIKLISETKNELRQSIRYKINLDAGDTPSLLGTTSDCVQLLLLHFSKLIVALESANSLEDVRAAAQSFKPLATQFVAAVDSGEVRLTLDVKTAETVINDVGLRATHVSNVLAP